MPSEIWNVWKNTAQRYANSIALIQTESCNALSFLQLDVAASTFANQYLTKKTAKSIAFSIKNNSNWLTAFLACQSVGAIPMPIDTGTPEKALNTIAADLGANYLWHKGHLKPLSKTKRFSQG